VFYSFNSKYKHPDLGSRAKEHKACILQRNTTDDGVHDLDPEFSIQYPHPFTQYWYNGEEGEKRLHAARNDMAARTQAQRAGGGSGASAAVGAVQLRTIDPEVGESEDRAPLQRSNCY